MKKFFVSLALFAALIFIVSCGESSTNNTNNNTDTGDTTSSTDTEPTDDADSQSDSDKTDTSVDDSCASNPCSEVENSDGKCYVKEDKSYTCGCNEGYFWSDSKCEKPNNLPIGKICTGIEKCYNKSEEIPCPDPGKKFFGQDAQYAKLGFCTPKKFLFNEKYPEQKTMVDMNTGLEWEMKEENAGWNHEYTWDEAVKYCEELNYSGHDDWRLPSPDELLTLFPYIYKFQELFQNYISMDLWTSKEFAGLEETDKGKYAWSIETSLRYSPLWFSEKHRKYHALCVRGEELPKAKLTEKKFGSGDTSVVTDSTNEFMWAYRNRAEVHAESWSEALAYCEDLTYAGFNDWRLPNLNEISTLINFDKTAPASDMPKNLLPPTVASSSPALFYDEEDDSYDSFEHIFGFDFQKGSTFIVSHYTADLSYYNDGTFISAWNGGILCVRSDKCEKGYFWDGAECKENKCNTDSCSMPHSTGICTPIENSFQCDCDEGYFWNGTGCVNPCEGNNPCIDAEVNPEGECTAVSATVYDCGCHEKSDGTSLCWNNGSYKEVSGSLTIGNICTGQTKCYDNEKEITCPDEGSDFYGQDAQHAKNGTCKTRALSSFTVSDWDKIIRDFNTQLEWQQTPSKKIYNWNDAKAYCENLTFNGKSDWRLPNPHELVTIIDHSRDPMPDPEFNDLSEWISNSLWSSKSFKNNPKEAWRLNFFCDHKISSSVTSGEIEHSVKSNLSHALCVRGNELPDGSFSEKTINEGEVILDSVSNLMWTRGDDQSGKTWKDGLSYCENLTYAGFSNWRLPNINELRSLVDFDEYNTAIPSSIIVNSGLISSTTRDGSLGVDDSNHDIILWDMVGSINTISGSDDRYSKEIDDADVYCVRNAE